MYQIHELTFGHSHGMIGGMNRTKLSIASAGVGLVVLGGATVFAMGQGTEPDQASNHLQAPETVVETVTQVETVTEEVASAPVVITEVLTRGVPGDGPEVPPAVGEPQTEAPVHNVGNPPVPPPTQPKDPETPPTTSTPRPTTTKPPTTTTQPPVTTTPPPTTTSNSPTTTATTPVTPILQIM